MQLQAFDEASRVRLMELLDAKSEHHNTMRCDEVQAFMMALLSGPDALNPNDWLPEVLGDESLFDAKERTEIERLVIGLAADLRIKLSKKMLPDLWLYEDAASNPDIYTWCNAYLYALDIVPTEKELAQLESELPHVLLDIYWYWQAIINKPQTVRREGDKTGRNDPCPCGSGKKYKACCNK